MTQTVTYTYATNVAAFDYCEGKHTTVDISQPGHFGEYIVRIVDDQAGNVCVVSNTPLFASQNPTYRFYSKQYFLVDGPYRTRTSAEKLLNS